MKLLKWLHQRKETIHIISSIGVIVAIIIGIIQFTIGLEVQKETELNEHILNMYSLSIELEKNIEAIDNLIENKSVIGTKFVFEELFFGNIERSISDGRVAHRTLKGNLIVRQFDITGVNNFLSFVNSPDFLSENLDTSKENLVNQFIQNLENETKPNLKETLDLVNLYLRCLETERNIDLCNDATYFRTS